MKFEVDWDNDQFITWNKPQGDPINLKSKDMMLYYAGNFASAHPVWFTLFAVGGTALSFRKEVLSFWDEYRTTYLKHDLLDFAAALVKTYFFIIAAMIGGFWVIMYALEGSNTALKLMFYTMVVSAATYLQANATPGTAPGSNLGDGFFDNTQVMTNSGYIFISSFVALIFISLLQESSPTTYPYERPEPYPRPGRRRRPPSPIYGRPPPRRFGYSRRTPTPPSEEYNRIRAKAARSGNLTTDGRIKVSFLKKLVKNGSVTDGRIAKKLLTARNRR